MKIILHAGAHNTEGDRLLRSLLRNTEDFAAQGIAVPGPGRYRPLLNDAFEAMESAAPSREARDVLIDAILDESEAMRMILSNPNLFGHPGKAVGDAEFYPLAAFRLHQLETIFAGDDLELFIAISNPALFLPSALANFGAARKREIVSAMDLEALRWSDMLKSLREVAPEVPITTWCAEDAPFIWPDIIRAMAGLPPGRKIVGGFDLLGQIMSRDGMRRFRAYLADHPDMTEPQKRRVMAAFLSKFALEDQIEEELDLPGWNDATIEYLTSLYEADVARIGAMPGVRLIAP